MGSTITEVTPPPTSGRAATLGAVGGTVSTFLAVRIGEHGLTGLRHAAQAPVVPVEDALSAVVALAAAVLCLVLTLVAGLGVLHVLPSGRRWALGLSPHWAPRAGAVLLALSLTWPPAHATHPTTPVTLVTESHSPEETPQETAERDDAVPLPGWLPTSHTPASPTDTIDLVSRGGGPDRVVTVLRGDTLWAIAAAHLGPGAGAEEIAAEWPRWHQHNRAVIGADPDLIHPGQQLTPPPTPADEAGLP